MLLPVVLFNSSVELRSLSLTLLLTFLLPYYVYDSEIAESFYVP